MRRFQEIEALKYHQAWTTPSWFQEMEALKWHQGWKVNQVNKSIGVENMKSRQIKMNDGPGLVNEPWKIKYQATRSHVLQCKNQQDQQNSISTNSDRSQSIWSSTWMCKPLARKPWNIMGMHSTYHNP